MAGSVAVLTGDLIASTRAGAAAVDEVMLRLATAAETLSEWVGEDTRFTRFRGDGWQVLCPRPEMALRASLFLFAMLRRDQAEPMTRIAVGVGALDFAGTTSLADASGPAFSRSGRCLDGMAGGRVLAADEAQPGGVRASFALADALVRDWTPRQAEVLALMLAPDPPTQTEAADRLGLSSQQVVAGRLRSASFAALDAALVALEAGDGRG